MVMEELVYFSLYQSLPTSVDHVASWRKTYSAAWCWGGISQEAHFKVDECMSFGKILVQFLLLSLGKILINVFYLMVDTGSVLE